MKNTLAHRIVVLRPGLTLIELILVILAISLLLSLVIPSVGSRGPSRRMECQFHLKELALATMNYATNFKGQLPDLRTSPLGLCDASIEPSIPSSVSFHLALFPYMDQAGAIEFIETQPTALEANRALSTVLDNMYKALTCPDDSNHFRKPGGNSYVANAGYGEFTVTKGEVTMGGWTGLHSAENWGNWDLAHRPYADPGVAPSISPLDKKIARATGVFWIPDVDGWKRKIDDIVNGDGSGQTLLFGENLNASSLDISTAPTAMDNAFVVGRTAIEFEYTAPKYLAFTSVPKPFGFAINQNRGTLVGQSPIPSSLHRGGVNFAFCDGHVSFLADEIDPSVYVRLMSPDGERWGQARVSESEY
ncbi:MAG: putative major pilin subunit [Planctomycetaceae bacterium]|nr:putative major pilin subunit [Planctomycetaceae bacterium]